MKRERRFCPYCGAIIPGDKRTCSAHRDLPRLDPHAGLVVRSATVTGDELSCEIAGSARPTISRPARSADK